MPTVTVKVPVASSGKLTSTIASSPRTPSVSMSICTSGRTTNLVEFSVGLYNKSPAKLTPTVYEPSSKPDTMS